MFAGIGAIVASLLFPEASRAAFVNTYTVNGVKWNLAADRYEGSQYIANPPANWSVYFADTHTGAPVYYCNMTLTGFSFTGSDSSRDITIPGGIDWDSGGSWGVEHGPLQFVASGAFAGKDVTSVKIPDSGLEIKLPCFRKCKNLQAFHTAQGEDMPWYRANSYIATNGVLFWGVEKNTDDHRIKLVLGALVKYPEGKEGNYFEVAETVSSLKAGCLAGTKLAAVRFLGDKPSCGDGVFEDSTFVGYCPESWGLAWGEEWNGIRMYPVPDGGIRVEDGVTNCYEIVDGVLWWALLRDGEATVMGAAGAKGLLEVPASLGGCPVTSILSLGSVPATSVSIPSSVTVIEQSSVRNCQHLEAFVVAPGNPVYASVDGVLFNKSMKSLVRCPPGKSGAYVIPEGVEWLDGWVFENCNKLTSIFIPSTVTNTFSVTEGLVHCKLPLIEVSGDNPAFASSDGVVFTKDMKTLVKCPEGKSGAYAIPSGVETIGAQAFYCCWNLTSMEISSSVASIGALAFEYCGRLTSFIIPTTVTSVGAGAFYGCSSNLEIQVAEGHPLFTVCDGALFSKDMKTLVALLTEKTGNYAIPAGVEIIGDHACHEVRLTSVTIPDGVTIIEACAFQACGLESVVFPESLRSIGVGAFEACNLSGVTIPSSVSFVGKGAFWGNWGLDAIGVDAANPAYASVDGVLYTKDMKTLVAFPTGKASENYVVLAGVEEIGDCAFGVCDNVSGVTLPEGLRRIGDRAFSFSWGLARLTIPQSVESVGAGAFEGCRSLATLYVPVTWEGTGLLEAARVPEGCEVIYRDAPTPPATQETPVAVPHSWLESAAAAVLAENGGDYESAAKEEAANGMPVWECYLAGLSPMDPAAEFKVKSMAFVDGKVVVTWDPDLNEGETKKERSYVVEGAETLGGAWGATNAASRFFRVRVGMP